MSKSKWNPQDLEKLYTLRQEGLTWEELTEHFPGKTANALRKAFYNTMRSPTPVAPTLPKILILDIETAPMEARVWGLFNQNISLESVLKHTAIISWAAKWRGSDKVMYFDNRNKKDARDDKELCEGIHSLMQEADVIIWHNGDKFDKGKLYYRFAVHKLPEPGLYKSIDTLKIAKSKFYFDSNKLAHLTKLFCKKHVKLDHRKFPGNELWNQCLAGNLEAWKEMEDYNKVDVLALEELYFDHLAAYDTQSVNFSVYSTDFTFRCNCGSDDIRPIKGKFYVTKSKSKFQIYRCSRCGKLHRDSKNLLIKDKRDSMKV